MKRTVFRTMPMISGEWQPEVRLRRSRLSQRNASFTDSHYVLVSAFLFQDLARWQGFVQRLCGKVMCSYVLLSQISYTRTRLRCSNSSAVKGRFFCCDLCDLLSCGGLVVYSHIGHAPLGW
jgi:hypothetical protein